MTKDEKIKELMALVGQAMWASESAAYTDNDEEREKSDSLHKHAGETYDAIEAKLRQLIQ